MLTPREAARVLNCRVVLVRRLLRSRKLPGVKYGREWRVPCQDLERYLAQIGVRAKDNLIERALG